MVEISVLIVNWNAGNLLKQAIDSILQCNFNLQNIEIIIIDNASSDNSVDMLPDHDSLQIIRNKENRGFGAACNQGYKASTGKYVLLLNPDTQVFKDTLQQCVHYMKNHIEIDILGVKHVDEAGNVNPSCSRFPNFSDFIVMATGLNYLAPAIFRPPLIMTDLNYNNDSFVDQVMGAFMFIRRSTIQKLEMFMDERFFVYFEDVEFSKRVALQGGKSFYNAAITIMHIGGGTTNQVKGLRLFYNLRSRLRYIKKYFPLFQTFILSFFTILIEPMARIILLLIKRKNGEVKEVLKGYGLLFRNII